MKKMILKGALLAVVVGVGGLFTSGAFAVPLPAEYEILNPDTTVRTSYSASNPDHYGYYIWTNDSRTVWNVEWTGGKDEFGNIMNDFSGTVSLYGNTVDSFATYKWENNDSLGAGNDWFEISAWAGYGGDNWYDGFTFTIINDTTPSYVAFDLMIEHKQAYAANHIYLGDMIVSEGDFAVMAPVPEPSTMILFGTGLFGLACYKRKKSKKA